ncbi:MAG: hypothetical protein HC800_16495 [Phormidesmis sp. RL_2_1]|nr:hypothetical protein [Phormidesmis sp. RL_2_1]
MYIVEFTLKHTAMPLTVQKKEQAAAEAAYKAALDAIASGNPVTLEATCDKVTDKKVAIAVSELAAVQIYEKSGSAGASGRAPGFFALAGDEK